MTGLTPTQWLTAVSSTDERAAVRRIARETLDELVHLREVKIAAIVALNAGDDRRQVAWRRLRELTRGRPS